MGILQQQLIDKKQKGLKSFAVLLDPDKINEKNCLELINIANTNKIDFFFVGGSLLTKTDNLGIIINTIKKNCNIPIILFPGSLLQINYNADAILLLSLISGRNPEFLIGQHVIAAPALKESNLEIISTGYILVDCGNSTTVSYMSNTTPIPYDKPDIAACTAMAGEMLGMKLIYLDGGSGAKNPVSTNMIAEVRKNCSLPLIVGGGINNPQKVLDAFEAGADLIVIGTGIEKTPDLISEISEKIRKLNVH